MKPSFPEVRTLTAFSLSTYQPGSILAHFEPTNLRGIVRVRYSCEVHHETDSHGGSWVRRWVLWRTFCEIESLSVVLASAQDACSREAEWPHDPQCAGFLHRASAGCFRSARSSEARSDYTLRESLRSG